MCRGPGLLPPDGGLLSTYAAGVAFAHRGRGVPQRPPPPPRTMILQMHTPALKSVLESANPRMDSGCASGCPWSTARATAPSPGRPTPGVVKQDKSSGGSVDTTKTRSGPQRVRMGSGERPIGAAKGTQSDTEALCQTPPPYPGPQSRAIATASRCTFVFPMQTLLCSRVLYWSGTETFHLPRAPALSNFVLHSLCIDDAVCFARQLFALL